MHALIFVIFILLLQQFDGNVLGPKILGNLVGLNGFWVMFAIVVGAGLFGFGGMLLGVPIFVVIYTFFKHLVDKKLARSGLPVDSETFKTLDHFDPKTGDAVELKDSRRTAHRRRRAKKEETAEHTVSSEDPETERETEETAQR